MLNPVHLQTLTAVIQSGSFADAARQLGYTGSAVSQQIAALERAVKMPLFERDARSVKPTPAGQFVAERSKEAIAALAAECRKVLSADFVWAVFPPPARSCSRRCLRPTSVIIPTSR